MASTLRAAAAGGASHASAARSAALAAQTPGWLWPRWLERRLDATSAADVVGPLGLLVNDAGRRWSVLGVLDGPATLAVDPTGLVVPAGARWALDWWIGGDDRWHLPAREVAVRQHTEGVGVVETAMRVPGGDAVQRVYAVRLAGGQGADPGRAVAVVEVENRSAVPFALALAVRPATLEGIGHIASVAVDDQGLLVDGQRAVLLQRAPRLAEGSTLTGGDAAAVVFAGAAGERFAPLEDAAGLAHATVILPLAHRATVRVLLPLQWSAQRAPAGAPAAATSPRKGPKRVRGRLGAARRGLAAGAAAPLPATYPAAVPTAAQVAAGWEAQLTREVRVELPDVTLQRVHRAALGRVVLAATVDAALDVLLDEHGSVGAAVMLDALLTNGFGAEAASLLAAWFDQHDADGRLPGGGDAPAVALWALERHLALRADDALLAAVAPGVHATARRLVAGETAARRGRQGTHAQGDRAAGGWWRRAGLAGAARLLHVAGDDEGAAAARAAGARGGRAATLAEGEVRVSQGEAPELVRAAALTGPGLDLAPGSPARLQLDGALGQVAALTAPESSAVAGLPVPQPGRGADPALAFATLTLSAAGGAAEVLGGLRRLVELAAPTGAWPARIHPRTGEGCEGSGDDPVVAATALGALRSLVVVEHDAGLDLCPVYDSRWFGAGLEAHGVPTRHGTLSFAVRWHERRPALLWELAPRSGAERNRGAASDGPAPLLRAPGLDAAWSSGERRGDTLLAEPQGGTPVTIARSLRSRR